MKGIAIKKLALLLLAIIVLAIIIFLLYGTFIGITPSFTKEECIGKLAAACVNCKQCFASQGYTWDGCPDPALCVGVCVSPSECSSYLTELGMSEICPNDCEKVGVYKD
jgi:hypothetical protein